MSLTRAECDTNSGSMCVTSKIVLSITNNHMRSIIYTSNDRTEKNHVYRSNPFTSFKASSTVFNHRHYLYLLNE